MRWLLCLSLAATVALGGCGDGPPNAEDTAREWVAAINAQDWNRACELSVKPSQSHCKRVAAEGFRDAGGEMRIEGFYRSGNTIKFAVTRPKTRNGGREADSGGAAYGPAELAVERHGGEYLVHFEVSVIR